MLDNWIKITLKIQKCPNGFPPPPKNTKTPLKHKFWFCFSGFVFLGGKTVRVFLNIFGGFLVILGWFLSNKKKWRCEVKSAVLTWQLYSFDYKEYFKSTFNKKGQLKACQCIF